ncbi:MAG: hypothetical protein KDA96_15615 [Planctomycetaceae bacterium]|nr:hypothetical protein [Planctomycetaceae bacterium]
MRLTDRIAFHSAAWLAVFCLVGLTGCEDAELQDYEHAELNDHSDHDHDHAHEGAHGGHLHELDDAHKYHAELVFAADSRDITLYFYGSEVGTGVPASDVVLELHRGDEGLLELKAEASPLDGETAETCSRFVVAGSQLPEGITSEEQLNGHFVVRIDNQDLMAQLSAHDHDEHGHHDDHEGHDHAEGEHGESHDHDDADEHGHADEHGDSK